MAKEPIAALPRMDESGSHSVWQDDGRSGGASFSILAFLALVAAMQQGTSPAPTAALVGVILVVLVYVHPRIGGSLPSRPLYLGTFLALGAMWLAVPSFRLFPHPPDLLVLVFGAIPVGIGVWLETSSRIDPKRVRALLIAAIIAIALIGAALIVATRDIGMDVLFLHKEAAGALADGVTPYGPAVNVANWAPTAAPDARIIGYPYPPVVALVFSIGEWMWGEPRWGGLAAWLVVLGALGAWGIAIRSKAIVRFTLMLMLIPWPLVIQAGFTETVTVALLALSAYLWRRHPVASSALLGLALSSKQYLLVLLPFLVLAPVLKGRRVVVTVAVASAALVPALFPNPALAWDVLVAFHADTLPRFDSPNLIGLIASLGFRISIPPAVPLVAALILAAVTATRVANSSTLFAAMALTLSVFFFLINQTNANYWILILVLLAMTHSAQDGIRKRDTHIGSGREPEVEQAGTL